MSEPPAEIDPLDLPSGCFIEKKELVERNGLYRVELVRHEVSFRELKAEVEHDMKILDTQFTPRERLRNQVHNDPDYREIEPMAGLRRSRRDLQLVKRAERMLQDIAGIRRRDRR